MPQKCSNEGSEGSCRVPVLAVAVPPVSGGGGGLDVLLHHAQLLVQAQGPVLALAVAGGGDLETIAVTVTIIYISAANRLISEVVQSRRRPLLGPSPG